MTFKSCSITFWYSLTELLHILHFVIGTVSITRLRNPWDNLLWNGEIKTWYPFMKRYNGQLNVFPINAIMMIRSLWHTHKKKNMASDSESNKAAKPYIKLSQKKKITLIELCIFRIWSILSRNCQGFVHKSLGMAGGQGQVDSCSLAKALSVSLKPLTVWQETTTHLSQHCKKKKKGGMKTENRYWCVWFSLLDFFFWPWANFVDVSEAL